MQISSIDSAMQKQCNETINESCTDFNAMNLNNLENAHLMWTLLGKNTADSQFCT